MPNSTTASPYSGICGANAISIWALAASVAPCAQPRAAGISSAVSGPASSATTAATGSRSSRDQVSRADAICRVCAAPSGPRDTGPASTGTTALVSAPPRTMS